MGGLFGDSWREGSAVGSRLRRAGQLDFGGGQCCMSSSWFPQVVKPLTIRLYLTQLLT